MFFVVSICVILEAVASPVSNVDNVRMARPSRVRSEDVPTSQSYKDHTIFNVPIPELIDKTPPFYQPQTSNQPMNQAVYQNPIVNLTEKGTKYLQNPYQNPSVLSSQQSISEIYQNGDGNIQTPIQRLQKLYQESSTLQKLLSNLNLIRTILAPKPQKKQFILVYPNGTIGYEDNLSTVSNKYPNHIILKSSELRTLTNVGNEIENGSDHPQPQENISSISSSITQSNTNNQIFDTNQSNSNSIVVNNNTESKNNIEKTNTEVIDTTINKIQNNSVIIPQNTLNDSASKIILQLKNSENLAYNTNNTTTAIHNISDSNENVGGIDSLTGNITLTEGSENISNVLNNIQKLQNTTIKKIDESANKDTTDENQISINSNTEPLHNVTSENSYSSEEVANSSNATNNGLDDGKTVTVVRPEYNITHDPNDAISDSNENVGGIDTLTDGNITLTEGYENILNVHNIQNLQNTTINKVDKLANKDTTNENQISINSNTEPLHNITSDNSYSSEDNSSNATNNGLDDGKTVTTVPPEYNITHDSNDAIFYSNENVGGIYTLTGNITLTEGYENILNVHNIQNLQNTTINKVGELANKDTTNENQISINSNTEPLHYITSENSYSSEDNSSNATNNGLDDGKTVTTVPPEYNITHDSNDAIFDSNENVGGIYTLTGNITLTEGSENISNAHNMQNLQNSTINKVDELANKDTTNENQISINSNTEPLHNIISENSYSSEEVTNSSNATNNGLDDGKTVTTVPPEYNITHDSDYDIGNIGSNNHNSSLVINNTNTQKDLRTNTQSEDITNVEQINDSLRGNVTGDCQYCEEKENDENGNIKLGAPDSVSWVQVAKESAKNILFGEDNPNVFFIFYNPPEMDVEKETRTTMYPNGTVVEEFIEMRKVDGTTIRTSTTKTYNNSSTIPLTTNR